jgi:hypothetical protein
MAAIADALPEELPGVMHRSTEERSTQPPAAEDE